MPSVRAAFNMQEDSHDSDTCVASSRDSSHRDNSAEVFSKEGVTMLQTVFLIFLVLLLIGSLPAWPYSSGWGYYPSGGLGFLVVILLLIALFRPPRTL